MSLDLNKKVWPEDARKHEGFRQHPARISRNPLYQRQFVSEGTMVALPMGFPNLTTPIPAGESAITCLTVGPDEVIYGGTSGRRAHLFCAMLRGATGFVHDLTELDGAKSCSAVGVVGDTLYACLNSNQHGWIVRRDLERVPFDCVQEWDFFRCPVTRVIEPIEGKKILHAVFGPDETSMIAVLDDGSLIRVDLAKGKTQWLGSAGPIGRFSERLTCDATGTVYGTSFDGRIWQLAQNSDKIEQWDVCIPCGAGRQFYNKPTGWAYDQARHVIYGASSADGTLFSIDLNNRDVRSLGQVATFNTVGALTVTTDGRLYGIAGGNNDIGRLFVYDPDHCDLRDLGVCVSTLAARVYGLVFQAATTWSDGTVIFGESDRVSHLWIYFPAIRRRFSADESNVS